MELGYQRYLQRAIAVFSFVTTVWKMRDPSRGTTLLAGAQNQINEANY